MSWEDLARTLYTINRDNGDDWFKIPASVRSPYFTAAKRIVQKLKETPIKEWPNERDI